MQRVALLALVTLALGAAACLAPHAATATAADGTRRAIAAVLDASARAWDRHDLTGFMRSYDDSPQTIMVGRTSVLRGYDAIRAHYAAHYGATGMGTLTFGELVVRPLDRDDAVAVARWHLALPDGTHPTGLTSLVFRREPGGWKIVADHSP